jgi:hypothetical protein
MHRNYLQLIQCHHPFTILLSLEKIIIELILKLGGIAIIGNWGRGGLCPFLQRPSRDLLIVTLTRILKTRVL